MATRSELQIDDISSNSGRSSPHAALGRIISFLDDAKGQAVVKYHANGHPTQANEEIQEAWDDEEEEEALQDAPEEHPGQGDDVEVQEVQRHLPGSHFPLPPATPDQLQAAVDPGEQATTLPPQDGQEKKTAQDLIGLQRRDGEAIEQTGRPQRVKRPINKFE